MNKKTTFTIIIGLMIFLINAQNTQPYNQKTYIQGVNGTINIDYSSLAVLTAIATKALPNGKE